MCRLSNYIDVWFKKNLERLANFPSSEEGSTGQMVEVLRQWIFKLLNLSLHRDAIVKFCALESLNNVVNFCLKYSVYISCLNDILKDDRLLEYLLFLLMPDVESFSHSPKLARMNPLLCPTI